MESAPESSERTENGSEKSENEEIASTLTTSSDSTESRANVNATMPGATMVPDPHTGNGDEIDKILAAAALQNMQHPMTIPDASQNSFVRHSTESAGRWPALGKVSQRNQITLGSEEVASLSHAMDSGGTGAFGSSWVSETDSLDQGQYQSEINRLHRHVPDTISNHTGRPCKRLCLGHTIDEAAAAPVPTQNYEDQTAITDNLTSIAGQGHLHSSQRQVVAPFANTTSAPTTMTSLQQNEALGRGTTTAMAGSGWNFVENFNDDLWNFEFNSNFIDFPITSPDNVGFQQGVTYQAANGASSCSMS